MATWAHRQTGEPHIIGIGRKCAPGAAMAPRSPSRWQ